MGSQRGKEELVAEQLGHDFRLQRETFPLRHIVGESIRCESVSAIVAVVRMRLRLTARSVSMVCPPEFLGEVLHAIRQRLG